MIVRILLLLTAVAAFIGVWSGDRPGNQPIGQFAGHSAAGRAPLREHSATAAPRFMGPEEAANALRARRPERTIAAQAYFLRCIPARACGRRLPPAVVEQKNKTSQPERLADSEGEPHITAMFSTLPPDAEPDGHRLVMRFKSAFPPAEPSRSFIALTRPPLPLVASSPKRDPLRRLPEQIAAPKRLAADVARDRVYR